MSSLKQGPLILIFLCHPTTAATRADNREAKESKQTKNPNYQVSKSSWHTNREDHLGITQIISSTELFLQGLSGINGALLECTGVNDCRECGWEEVSCQGTAGLGFLPLNIPSPKESTKIKIRLGSSSSLICKSSYNFIQLYILDTSAKLKLEVLGALEVSSKSSPPFFTSQHKLPIKVRVVESSSSTEAGMALLCFRGCFQHLFSFQPSMHQY